ncbi:ABC transporter ATP-binding protein [Magnetospirillum sulfuroxidans]|uniref:ABC transporter ATP-binding protein n=1 Tax=Magnetospirillum sulfuroxidans TaxID=611300 RepID=A0ABS5IAM2_9PROT|nr:ABC transporter ATP-binding protein [Magnetospirillum sulfuroxidans]MBR9971459.1 ABC transporter ATP-binding protein [Magnetospirillum sulfuroxidans]
MSAPIVSCRALTKTYGQGDTAVQALRGVDFDAAAGEVVMLVGPSGCGKTTLLSVIAGVLDCDGGACQVLGHDLRGESAAAKTRLRRHGIGFVFQSFNLVPTLSVAENVAVPLLIQGEKRRLALERAREALVPVGLADKALALPAQLSGGQQQRVAIARAIVHQPPLIVCDEPTSALDHRTGDQVVALLRQLAQHHQCCLLVVTHDNRIFSYADRIAEMDDGHIVAIRDASPAIGS